MIQFTLPGSDVPIIGPLVAPKTPRVSAPPPVPTRDSAAEDREAARKKQRQSEARRKGRAATILTDPETGLGSGAISRPQARSSRLLGG